jgi:hypothetical protein
MVGTSQRKGAYEVSGVLSLIQNRSDSMWEGIMQRLGYQDAWLIEGN